MTVVEDWSGFVRQVRDMYAQNPDATRLVVKHNRQRTHVSVKATDNVSCLKFVASNAEQCRRVEGLAALVIQWSFVRPSKGQELTLAQILDERQPPVADSKKGRT